MENINALKGSMLADKFAAFNVKADTVKAAQKKRRQPERVKTGRKVHARKCRFYKMAVHETKPQGGENVRNYRYLTLADRETLEASYLKGARPQDIADTLGVHVATIYKELKRGDTGKLDGNMRQGYSATLAQYRLQQNFKCRGRKAKDGQKGPETAAP